MSLLPFSLDGKTALVTGGNGGIGRAIALGLRSAGSRVVVTGRNPEKNAAMASELGEDGMAIHLDVRDEVAVQKSVSDVVANFGSLDILINNAGIVLGGSVLEMPREKWGAVSSLYHSSGCMFGAEE